MNQPANALPNRWLVYASPLLLLLIALFSAVLFKRAEDTGNEVRRIDRIRLATVKALSDLQDAETGQRGFLLTGHDEYLEPYAAGRDSIRQRMAELAQLTGGEPIQEANLQRLQPIVDRRLSRLDSAIAQRRAGNMSGAIAIVAAGGGKALMDSARRIFTMMRREEGRQLLLGEDRERKDRVRLQIVLIVGVVLSGLMSFVVSYRLLNDATKQWLMNAELQSRIAMLRSQSPPRTSGEHAQRSTPTSSPSIPD